MNLGLLLLVAALACVFVVAIVVAVRGPRGKRPGQFDYLTYEPEDAEPVSEQDLAAEVEAWLRALGAQ